MENTRKYALKAAALAAAVMILSLLPAVITGGGALTLRDDFNYQQIIFSIEESSFIKSGTISGWSYTTDLGSDILTSYSFYGLTSPFTLILALLPSAAVPYALAPMIALKVAFAALTAFYFIKRFVKKPDTAVLGALLYALSGYQTMNLMFPFYDVTAFFPLLLIAVEEAALARTAEGRKSPYAYGALALACCLMSCVNYYFFFGAVIFVIIYFLFRFVFWSDVLKTIKEKLAAAAHCLIEGLLGTLMSAFVLLPSAISVLANPRVGSTGNGLVFDWTNYISIIQAYLFPADVMGSQRYFIEKGCTSCSLWLPFVAIAFVIAYAISNKKSSLTYLIGALCVFSLVPVLNSAFSMFNSQYYARWFFMFSLILALATAIELDMSKPSIKKKHMITGSAVNAIITVLFAAGLLVITVLLKLKGSAYYAKINTTITDCYCLAAAVLAFALLMIVMNVKKRADIVKIVTVCVLVTAIGANVAASLRYKNGSTTVYYGTTDTVNSDGPLSSAKTLEIATGITKGSLGLSDDENYRINTVYADEGENYYSHSYDNLSMVLGVPSVNGFISTVGGGIFEFYNGLGIERRVTSYPPLADDAFYALTSCKYRITGSEIAGKDATGSFTHSDGSTIFVYEYDNFLPLGFVYDTYMTEDELMSLPVEIRSYALLNAVVADDGAANGLTHISAEKLAVLAAKTEYTSEELTASVNALKENSSDKFSRSSDGFTASVTSDKAGLCYFSIPYSSGWTAKVNGETVEVTDSNGMMAIPVSIGVNEIVFTYETPGLKLGIVISCVSVMATAGFVIAAGVIRKKKSES